MPRDNYQGRDGNEYSREYGRGRRYDGRDFMDGGQRRDFGSYGSEYLEDGFGSLRDPRREGHTFSGSDIRFAGMSSQDFRGRGPKGWQRSDERIQEDLSVQLEQHRALDASDIEVKVQDGEVIRHHSIATKRPVEDIAERVPGEGGAESDPSEQGRWTERLGGATSEFRPE